MRLLDMGMDPFNFADSLLAVLAQRLVRRLCSQCRTSRAASADEIDELMGDYLHAFGAEHSSADRDAVLQGWAARHAVDGRLRLRTLRQDGIAMVLGSITMIEEVRATSNA